MNRPEIIIFDVNETLLSLASLRPGFIEIFGSADLMGEWFARMLHASLVSNHVDDYRPFGQLGTAALLMLGRKHGIDITQQTASEVVAGMRSLEAHDDVRSGIDAIRAKGYRTAILTNGSTDAAADQIRNAGLDDVIDEQLTVEIVGKFKPAREVYLAAADRFGVEPPAAMLVAAHDWDIAGAAAAGYRTAFVTRPGVSWTLPGQPPDLVGADIPAIAEVLP